MIRGLQKLAIIKVLVWLVLTGITVTTINQALFIHAHRLANGAVVTHAHPYSSSDQSNEPYKSHHHSQLEYLLLDNFQHIFICTVATIAVILTAKKETVIIIDQTPVFSKKNRPPLLRGPPKYFLYHHQIWISGS